LIAVAAGLFLSIALFVCSYAGRSYSLFLPQAIGFYVCAAVLGVHVASQADFAAIAIPVNAAIYSVIIFGLARIVGRKRV
jgi:hypothetical protein